MVGNIKHYNGRAIREQTIVNSLFCMCYWEEYTLLFTHRSSLFNAWMRGKSLKADFQSSHEAPRSSLRVLASN